MMITRRVAAVAFVLTGSQYEIQTKVIGSIVDSRRKWRTGKKIVRYFISKL